MKALPLLVILLILVCSCSRNRPAKVETATDTAMVHTGLITGDPIDFYNDKMLVFPVGGLHIEAKPVQITAEIKGRLVDNKVVSTVFFDKSNVANAYYAEGTFTYRIQDEESQEVKNLIFYNKFTKEKYLLEDSALRILSFAIHKEFKKHLIFYEMVKADRNGDSLFNSKDGTVLFISDTDGKNLIQLSPDNEMYLTYFFYPETNTLLIKSLIDSNGDKKFTEGEETRFTEVDLNNPQPGKDIFTDDFKTQLKNMAAGN